MNRLKWPANQPVPDTAIRGPRLVPVEFRSPALVKLNRKLRRRFGKSQKVIAPKRNSRGLMFRGRPYYWHSKGFYRSGGKDRRPMQHHIWEHYHGRSMPPQHEIFFRDRDRHNFTRRNLQLMTKAEVHRLTLELGEVPQISPERRKEIAGRRWCKQSRRMTATLLKSFNAKEPHEDANNGTILEHLGTRREVIVNGPRRDPAHR